MPIGSAVESPLIDRDWGLSAVTPFEEMQPIRIHRRSKRQMLFYDIASVVGCWIVAFFVVSASRYNAFASWFCGLIVIACTALYIWDMVVIWRGGVDFELVLTNSRLSCRSPNQRVCADFEIELSEIEQVACDPDGAVRILLFDSSKIELSPARSFGAPIRLFVQDIVQLNPHIVCDSPGALSRQADRTRRS